MSEICTLLKETRQSQGLTLEDVAQKTYIKLPYLQALEEGAIEALPAPVYTYGYIRQYAKLLGLDGSSMVAQFQQLERQPGASPESPAQRSHSPMADLPGDPFNPLKASYKPNGNGHANGNGHSNGHTHGNGHSITDTFSDALSALKGNGARPGEDNGEVRQARMQAQQIKDTAEREAREMIMGAERYADDVLAQLEGEVGKALQIIRNGRQFLQARRHGGPTGY